MKKKRSQKINEFIRSNEELQKRPLFTVSLFKENK